VAELAIVVLGSIWFRNDRRSRAPRNWLNIELPSSGRYSIKRGVVHDSVCGSAMSTNGQDGHKPRLRPEARSRDRTASVTLAAAQEAASTRGTALAPSRR
jgi:hypothetical protein